MIYTPSQFLYAYHSILLAHPELQSVQIRYMHINEPSLPCCSADLEPLVHLDIQLCCTLRRADAGCSLHSDSSPTWTNRYHVLGSAASITREWCAQLQRLQSTFTLLCRPSVDEEGFIEVTTTSALRQEGGLQPPAPQFIVELDGLLPPMVWSDHDDGFFGSHHSLLTLLPVFPLSSPHRDDAAAVGCDIETPAAAVEEGEKEAAPATQQTTPETTLRQRAFLHPSDVLRVGVVVNAVLPMQGVQLGKSLCVMVLHAPDRQLYTADALPPSSSQQELLSFMHATTVQELMPRVRLDAINATWRRQKRSSLPASGDIDTFPLAGIGSSGWGDLTAAGAGLCRVSNIVLVLDCPLSCWQQLMVWHASSYKDSQQQQGGKEAWEHALSQMAEALTAALIQCVSHHSDLFLFRTDPSATAEEGEESESSATTAELGGNGRKKRCFYPNDVLRHCIAENITRIICSSSNPEFVKEAERLLFEDEEGRVAGAPSTKQQPGYYSMAAGGQLHTPLTSYSFAHIRRRIEEGLLQGG